MSVPGPSPPNGGSDPSAEGSSYGQSKEQEDQRGQVAQEPPRMTQEPPRMTQEPPRMAQEPPRMAQEPPRMAQEPPRMAQEPPRMMPHVQVHVEPSLFKQAGKPMVPTRLIVPATNTSQTTAHSTQATLAQSHKAADGGPTAGPAHSLPHMATVGGMGHLPLLGHGQPGPQAMSRGAIQPPHLGTHIPASLPLHGFTSHVPRGAAAAASLTPAAKGNVTTVLRPPSAGPAAFPVSTPSAGLVQTQAIPPQVKVQARAIGGSSTPPVMTTNATRTTSPAVSSGPEQHRASVFPPHASGINVGLVRGEGTASPHLTTLPTRSLQVSHVIGMPQHKSAVTAATVAPMMAHATTVTTTTSTQSATVTQVSTSASAVTFAPSSSHSSAVSSASIPIAKVLPQPIAHSPRPLLDYSGDSPGMPPSGSLFLPSRQRGSPNTVNTAVSMVTTASHSDSRPERSQFLLSHRPTQASLPLHTPPYTTITPAYYYDPAAALRYPHHTAQAAMAMHTYQAAQAAAHFTPISCSASAIRPLVASPQASVAAAAVAVAAQHAGGMRPGPALPLNHPMFLSMEAARQAQQVPPSITTASEASESSASSLSGSFAGVLGGATTQTTLAVGAPGNPNSSPRPSILRKRTNDGVRRTASATTPTNSDPNSPRLEVAPPTAASPHLQGEPKTEATSSQAGEVATATDGESATTASEVKVKEEPIEISAHSIPPGAMTVNQLIASVVQAATTPTMANTSSLPVNPPTGLQPEASPRKKPRKQQHIVATEDGFAGDVELKIVDSKSEFQASMKKESRERRKEQVEDILYVLKRFPRPSLLSSYRHGWKARLNHFQRYSDFKVKEKKPSLHDVCSQKGLAQKAAGWKVHHLANQLDELACNEQDTFAKMSSFHEALKAPGKKIMMEEEMRMIQELIQGNIQRAQLTTEQLNDTKQQMVKIVEKHKGEVCDIIKKNCSRKSSKKKSSS